MSFRVGDTVFSQAATPMTVVDRDEAHSRLKIDRDYQAFQVGTRHGLMNGIAPEVRTQLNAILDEAKKTEDDSARVGVIHSKIEELKQDPKNFRLVQYLDAEVRHLMNVKGVKPRFFATEEFKVR